MNKRRFRYTFLVWCLTLAPCMASGQAGPISKSTETGTPAAQALLPFLGAALRQARDWRASEASVLQELRAGLGRLEKACTQKSSALRPESPDARPTAPLGVNLQFMQDALAVRESRASAFERQADTWSADAAELVARQCTGVSATLGLDVLKSPACKRAESARQGVQALRQELSQVQQTTVERYRTYGQLSRVEQQGCARTGFTARLIQADDAHMRPAEIGRTDLLEQWNKEIRDLLRASGEQP